ncbi:rbcL, partial [Symbiodinium sp. KB8]
RHAYVTSTVTFSKMEGDASDMNVTFVLQHDKADGLCHHWKWEGIKRTPPIVSGATSAWRFPASFKNLGHCNATLTTSGCSFGYRDKPQPVAAPCCQGVETRKHGDMSLIGDVLEIGETGSEFYDGQRDGGELREAKGRLRPRGLRQGGHGEDVDGDNRYAYEALRNWRCLVSSRSTTTL